jgi:hypothetical protein
VDNKFRFKPKAVTTPDTLMVDENQSGETNPAINASTPDEVEDVKNELEEEDIQEDLDLIEEEEDTAIAEAEVEVPVAEVKPAVAPSSPTVTIVDSTPKTAPDQRVKIKLSRDYRCTIGGVFYEFEKDKTYPVPKNVKLVLNKEPNLLKPL